MKPNTKVSIGGLAFSIDEDAYAIIHDYFEVLRKHFSRNAEKDEIIADIEQRMSELLMLRNKTADSIVTKEDAEQIINIMGNPKDFGDEEYNESSEQREGGKTLPTPQPDKEPLRKKLYRDSNGIISGICSGLGYYFKADPVLIRIIVVVLLFIINLISFKWVLFAALLYGIFSLIIPKAKTVEEKIHMRGTDPSIENIESKASFNPRNNNGSPLLSFLKAIFNVVLVIVLVISCISIIGTLGALSWLNFETGTVNVQTYMTMMGLDSFDFKIALFAFLLIPIVLFIGLIVKLLVRSKFTTKNVVVFIAGVCLWLGSLFYITTKNIFNRGVFREHISTENTIDVITVSDTLYVDLEESYKSAIAQPNTNVFFYEDRPERHVFMLPSIDIIESNDSTLTNFRVIIEEFGFKKSKSIADSNQKLTNTEFVVTDSLITVKPEWYSNENPWRFQEAKLRIYAPKNKKVIIRSPLNENQGFYSDIHFRHGRNGRHWKNRGNRSAKINIPNGKVEITDNDSAQTINITVQGVKVNINNDSVKVSR